MHMCFSPEASFTASAALAAIGGVSVRRAGWSRALPFAAIPLVFSVHQFAEGLNWRMIGTARDLAVQGQFSILLYTIIAFVVWPMFVPLAVALVETEHWRLRAIAACGGLGALVGVYFLVSILREPPSAVVHNYGIEYDIHAGFVREATLPYIFAAIAACALSSGTMIRILGALWFASAVVAYVLVADGAFASTWCFFAGAISFCVVAHVREWNDERHAVPVSTAHA